MTAFLIGMGIGGLLVILYHALDITKNMYRARGGRLDQRNL